MKMTYGEQLKHPNWQRRRLEVLQQSDFKCSGCGADDQTLHVHHRRYVRGRMAWEYSDDELRALCEECHQGAHANQSLLSDLLVMLPVDQVIGLISGYVSGMYPSGAPQWIMDAQEESHWHSALGRLAAAAELLTFDQVEAMVSEIQAKTSKEMLAGFDSWRAAN